ncbi:MAG: hypothetical protein EBR89_05665 [Betaproteobacteria bacterium]|nr:hypothetical protein [Betaproteobacteria bacterium]
MNFKYCKRSLCSAWALSCALLAVPAQSAPRTPPDDAIVIEKLPFRATDNRARELASMRASAHKAPGDTAAAAALAQAYFDMAQARGDPRYIGYAEAVVSRFERNMSIDLLVMRGVLSQYRHDFDQALMDFAAALVQDPERADAHAWRGAIYLVQAQYDKARTECAALLKLQRPVLHGGCTGLTQAYMDDRFAAAKLRGDTTHRAEEARFQLRLRKNSALAVQLAAANYQVQKEPRDLRVLLESALAAGNADAAKPARDWLQSSGFEDARLRTLAAQTLQLPSASKNSGVTP